MPFFIRYILTLLISVFILNGIYGQSSPDKLRKKIKFSGYSYSQKVYFADSLLLYYRSKNPDSALCFIHQMLFFAKKAKDPVSVDYGYSHLGSVHRVLGNFDSSIYYYKIALKRYNQRNYQEGIASVYSNLANVYKLQSRYDLAIKNYLEAIDVFKKSENHNALANAYSGLAGLYYKLENINKADEFWRLSEKEYKAGKPIEHISHAYRGKAKVYLAKKKYKNAYMELKKAFINDSIFPNTMFMAENLILKMEWLIQNNNFPLHSNAFHQTSVKLREIINIAEMPVVTMRFYDFMGDYYRKQPEMALAYYDSSLNVIQKKEDDSPELRLNILRKKFNLILTESSEFKLINEYNILKKFEDEVAKIKKDRITQETDARYSLKDKEEKIKILRDKNKAANALIEKEKELAKQTRTQNIILWSGIGLFLIFITYILIINRKLKYTQKELKKNIEQKDYLFRELNHRVKNNLHIVSSFLSIESFGKSDEVQKILHTCENRIHSLGLVHEMLYKNDISENINVKSYIEKLVQVIKETLINDDTEIICKTDETPVLSSQKMVLVGLIANELITNSVKYAKLQNQKLIIQIIISTENDKIKMLISDNGKGISEENLNPNSIGLKMAKGLARQLEAEFKTENLSQGVQFSLLF